MEEFTPTFIDSYDPLKAGSIDGTDEIPHDRAIVRAINAKFKLNKHLPGDQECTIFVARLSPNTTEQTIQNAFQEFGEVVSVKIVRDIVSGFSKCYGFIEMGDSYQARVAVRSGHKMILDDHEILVDSEKGRVLKGWVPRRLGGGLGGKRESGQLRFGGRDRPFCRPILQSSFNESKDEIREEKYNSKQSFNFSREHRSNNKIRRDRSRERRRTRSRSRSRNRSTSSRSYNREGRSKR